MKIKFNEQNAIETMRAVGFVDDNNIKKTIYDIAKYNFHIKQMDDKQNYNDILKYITEHCSNIVEAGIYKDIDECIKNCKKRDFCIINEVCITKSEMDFIKNLNDIREEKATFVMLAIAKYYNVLKNTDYDSAFINHTDICKMARITISKDDRDIFMRFAYTKGVLYKHSYASSIVKKLTFVSHDENDPIVLRLKEPDYNDLAYTYLAYLTPSKFRRCVSCGKYIKKTKDDKVRLCIDCAKKEEIEKNTVKEVQCIDCGKTIYISVFDSQTNRCEECYSVHRRQQKTETMRKLRAKE